MTDREKLTNLIMQKFGWKISPETEYKIIINANLGELVDALVFHGVTVKEMQKPLKRGILLTNSPCWIEIRYDDGYFELEPVEITKGTGENYYIYRIGEGTPTKLDGKEYGKWWRCWAEKPTEEERRDAEWMK
jgi:hypothetical protein